MSVVDLERNYKELVDKVNTLENRVDLIEERLVNGGEHMEKLNVNYETMRSDINDLKNDLKASYQESVTQIMTFFNENQRNEFELRKNDRAFLYKIVGTALGSGGIVWILLDFLTKR